MSKRDRDTGRKIVTALFALIILFLFVMLIYDSGRKHGEAIGEYAANTDTYARYTQEHIADCLTLAEDGSKTKCIIDEVEASNEHERAEKDLVAQTEMALWALGMLVVSTLMMLVSALGVWWIRDTLVETRKAVKAADEAVTVTREIGQNQTRAYTHAEKAHFFWGGKKQDKPRVEIWVRNSGQTPAHWYEIRIKEFVYEHGIYPDGASVFDMVDLPKEYEGRWNAIAPDVEGVKATFYFYEPGEVERINKAAQDDWGLSYPSHGFSIAGEVRYKTFFGETFISQFVFGRNGLPSYKLEEVKTRDVDGITINANIEEPIFLARYSSKLKTYEKVEN